MQHFVGGNKALKTLYKQGIEKYICYCQVELKNVNVLFSRIVVSTETI